MRKQTRLLLLILAVPVVLSLGYQYGAFDFLVELSSTKAPIHSSKPKAKDDVDRMLNEVRSGEEENKNEDPPKGSAELNQLSSESFKSNSEIVYEELKEMREFKDFEEQTTSPKNEEKESPEKTHKDLVNAKGPQKESKDSLDSKVKPLSWIPPRAPIQFKESPGLKGSVEYEIFYGDSTKLQELQKWEASLRVAVGNIFYLSARNQWNLPNLSRAINEKFNGILPGKWVDSVAIIHIELNPGQHVQQNLK